MRVFSYSITIVETCHRGLGESEAWQRTLAGTLANRLKLIEAIARTLSVQCHVQLQSSDSEHWVKTSD